MDIVSVEIHVVVLVGSGSHKSLTQHGSEGLVVSLLISLHGLDELGSDGDSVEDQVITDDFHGFFFVLKQFTDLVEFGQVQFG